jgi:hypothetical protein
VGDDESGKVVRQVISTLKVYGIVGRRRRAVIEGDFGLVELKQGCTSMVMIHGV